MPLQIPLPTADPFTDIEQYVPLLLSSIEGFLQLKSVWAAADYDQAYSYMEDLKSYLVENLPPVIPEYAHYVTHFHALSHVVFGAALNMEIFANQPFNHSYRQNVAAPGDTFLFNIPLDVNSYYLDVCYIKATGGGILRVTCPDGTQQTIDTYNNTTTYNNIVSIPFAVGDTQNYQVLGECTGKNASSSAYNIRATYFAIRPQ